MNFWRLLDNDQWTAVSALGTVASAIGSLVGLLLVARQLNAARKTADLQALQEFLRATTEREAALSDALTADAKEAAFLQFTDFLELQAAALQWRLFSRVTAKIVREKLVDSIATIEMSPSWMAKLEAARSSPTAYEYLFGLMHLERPRIDMVQERIRSMDIRTAEPSPATAGSEKPASGVRIV